MFNVRKYVLTVLVIVLVGMSSSAFADTTTVEISISGLSTVDLSAVDLTVEYDNALVTTDGYTVTDALGSVDAGDAEDWSGISAVGDGFDVSIFSWLTDFSSQADSFVLATLTLSSDDGGALAAVNLDDFSYIDLVDQNNNWISAYTVETTARGFNISVASASAVPEPSAFTLLAFGLLGLTQLARRRA
ncbi:PEP-CTERM sorting domain-containing protein [Desulfobacter curvatus]|uniref:PEP-CTERM sorting domain-containing protein n=1 Tax=Desulfobacter curvatus TaxID=2290 RepID=UPI00036679DC|nr:PEP-CTERM sorting domain-containing protein [Desulfobacter curvatus]